MLKIYLLVFLFTFILLTTFCFNFIEHLLLSAFLFFWSYSCDKLTFGSALALAVIHLILKCVGRPETNQRMILEDHFWLNFVRVFTVNSGKAVTITSYLLFSAAKQELDAKRVCIDINHSLLSGPAQKHTQVSSRGSQCVISVCRN